VAAILESGADPRPAASGKTAWELTSSEEIRTLLETHGATAMWDR
jgi:hypothetical protein